MRLELRRITARKKQGLIMATPDETHQRLAVLEQSADYHKQAVERMDKKMDTLIEAMQSLIRIEEQQLTLNAKVDNCTKDIRELDDRMRNVEMEIPNELDKRLGSIEVKMPGLVESRKWVVGGVLGVITMIGAAIFALVLK